MTVANTDSANTDHQMRADVRPARLLAYLGIGGALTAIILVGALHILPQTVGIDPVRRTISEYALSNIGWVFNVGVLALAVGSLAIIAALVLAGLARAGSLGAALGVVWAAALLVVMVFPKHNWAVGPSTNGQIHRIGSIVAFLALPAAVLLLTRRRRTTTGRQRQAGPARVACWLAVLSLAWFTPLLGALVLSPVTGTPWWQAIPLGLVERGLVISEVLAVIALGVWVLQETNRQAPHRQAPHQQAPHRPGGSPTATTPSRSHQPASPAPTGPAG